MLGINTISKLIAKYGLTLILLFLFINICSAQRVSSKSYDSMLNGLLSHSVKEVEVSKINESDSSIVFLDAREIEEYEISHIKNAIWIGYEDFNFSRVNNIAKNKDIVVYCSVGYRSEKIAERMVEAGFKNVSNMYGSIFEWVNQSKPVYDSKGQPTKKVHA